MQQGARRGSAAKTFVGVLVAGAIVVGVLWGLLAPEPGMMSVDRVQALAEANATLDAFHDAAARADLEAYFAHFAPEGVFIGTDATERWTVDAFRAYAQPHFADGTGWTYVPVPGRRNIILISGNNLAVFDEIVLNAKYGECRGSGTMRWEVGRWLIVQYNLHFPVPNDLAEQVTGFMQTGAMPAQEETAPE